MPQDLRRLPVKPSQEGLVVERGGCEAQLSIAMIRHLNERLGISAEVLIRPCRKRAA